MTGKTIAEIYDTPVLLLTKREINKLDPKSRAWAIRLQQRHALQRACHHERVLIGDRRGWHRVQCKWCGFDMTSYSGGES